MKNVTEMTDQEFGEVCMDYKYVWDIDTAMPMNLYKDEDCLIQFNPLKTSKEDIYIWDNEKQKGVLQDEIPVEITNELRNEIDLAVELTFKEVSENENKQGYGIG